MHQNVKFRIFKFSKVMQQIHQELTKL